MKDWMGRLEPLNNTTIRNIIKLTLLNRCKISPYYGYRFLLTFIVSGSFFLRRTIEWLRFHRKIKRTKIEIDPIFIIGPWRTGTTYLHYLISLDKTKGFVTNLDTYGVHFSLTAGRLAQKLVKFAIPEKRPMDNVELSGSKPGEDEFALAMLGKYSFYHAFIFPRKIGYFSKYLTFVDCSKKDIDRWQKSYHYFLQKITFKNTGKQLIIKNPPHTGRIKLLLELYPSAKFIFLMRNPYEVYSSTLHLFKSLLPIFSLQKWDMVKIKEYIIDNFMLMMDEYMENKSLLKSDQIIEVDYEQLIKEPLITLQRIYDQLRLEGFKEHKEEFQKYISSQKEYQTNVYDTTQEIILKINENWGKYFTEFGYKKR